MSLTQTLEPVDRGRFFGYSLERLWPLTVIAWFAVVYGMSLTFVYIEGDDAASIAYHLLGQASSVQPPYSPYQGFMDLWLSLLTPNEETLRRTAMAATAFAAVYMTIVMLAIVFDWLMANSVQRIIITIVILLGCPELYFLGLYYSPSVIAMCFVLSAHYLIRGVFKREAAWTKTMVSRAGVFIGSAGLFGVGTACRWDIGVYGAVIVVDLMIIAMTRTGERDARRSWKPACSALLWGAGALLSSFAAIFASGYGVEEITRLVRGSTQYGTSTGSLPTSWMSILALRSALLVSLISPGFGLLAVLGLIGSIRRRDPLLLVVLVGSLVVLPWALKLGVPKMLLPAVPGLLYCVASGLVLLQGESSSGRVQVRHVILLALLLAPWIVGLRVTVPGSAWGPGFEMKAYDRAVSDAKFSMDLTAGSAVPTFEGPRPLLGYSAVLLGGQWRSFVSSADEEIGDVVRHASYSGLPLVLFEAPDRATVELLAQGYSTRDHRDRVAPNGSLNERRFVDREGRFLLVYGCVIDGEAPVSVFRRLLTNLVGTDRVVIKGYPRTVRGLHQLAPDALHKLGPTSAILDIEQMRKVLASAPASATTVDPWPKRCGDANFGAPQRSTAVLPASDLEIDVYPSSRLRRRA